METNKRCAPGKIYNDGSCIPVDVLIDMAKAYNKENNNKNPIMIKDDLDTLNPSILKRHLVGEFTNRLKGKCDDQICWTKQNFVKHMTSGKNQDLKNSTFRPHGPAGQFTWLSTVDIDKVMTQYETKYKDFKFLGAVPIDFDGLPQLGLKTLDFKALQKSGKTKLGIVFNLDEHYKSGSHWVAGFIDIEKGQIYYSDSYAGRPEQRIRTFLRRAANYCKECGINDLDVQYNKTRHQKEGSECGVYSINFILRLLKGESFDSITGKRLADRKVNKCRSVYFNNAKIK
jgi:hypothetical protein